MQHVDEGRLHAWLDGELPADEARALERHLDECAACRALVEEERRIRDAASSILRGADPGPISPPGVIPLHLSPARGRRVARPWVTLGWAASVVLALGIGWLAGPRRPREIAVAPATVEPRARPPAGVPTAASVSPEEARPVTAPPAESPPAGAPRTTDLRRTVPDAETSRVLVAPQDVSAAPPVEMAPPPPPPPPAAEVAPPPPPPAAPVASKNVETTLQGRVAGVAVTPAPRARASREFAARSTATPDSVTVRGVVRDHEGHVLSGALVSVPALGVRTVTRPDGRYVLALPAGRIADADSVKVVASRIGMEVQTLALAAPEAGATLNFALTPASVSLEGVVVTASGAVANTSWRYSELEAAGGHIGHPLVTIPRLPVSEVEIGEVEGRRAARVTQSLPNGEAVILVQRRDSRVRACQPRPRISTSGGGSRATFRASGLIIDASARIPADSLRATLVPILCPSAE